MKTCTRCNCEKSLGEFPSNGGGKLRPECKSCLRVRVKAHRVADPERAREISKAHYDRNREKILERQKTPEHRARAAERSRLARAANATPRQPRLTREELSARRAARYQANRERELEKRRILRQDPEYRAEAARRAKEWREQNHERFASSRESWRERNWQKVLESNARRRALMRATQVEKIDRMAVYDRDGGRCHICGDRVSPTEFVLDHLIPLAHGGPHVASNLRVAHGLCNSRMGAARLPAQLLLVA